MTENRTPLSRSIDGAMANLQEALDVLAVLRDEDPAFGRQLVVSASGRLTPAAIKLMQTLVLENSNRLNEE